MTLHVQAFFTVLSLINPFVCGMIFDNVETGRSRSERLSDAAKAAAAIFVILELAALVGVRVLKLFGISLDVFSIAGGGVLVWMGFSMLKGSNTGSTSGLSLTPLILFAASPGTITGVITLAVSHSRDALPVTALVSVAAATLVTGIVLAAVAVGNVETGKPGFVRATGQSLMGLIVMAMGTQFAAQGLTNLIKGGGV